MVLGVSHLHLIILFSDREQRYSLLTHHDSPLSSSQGEGIPQSGNIRVEAMSILKLNFSQYSSIHTNYIISHCTTLQYNQNI